MAESPPAALTVAAPRGWRELCFSLPATRALAAVVGELSLLVPETQREFWRRAGFERLLPYPTDAPPRRIAPLLDGIGAVLLWEAGAAADACAKAGIAERIGLPAPGLVKRLTRPLELSVSPGPPEHAVSRFLDVADLLGADPRQAEYFVSLEAGAERDPNQLLVVPGSDFGPHFEWPTERWVELLGSLKDPGCEPLIGGPEPAASRLAEATGLPSVAIDPADPDSFAGYRRCLAADGSLTHLAAAFGSTCTVLFGPGDPIQHRPLGKQHRWIRRKAECAPCFLEKCPIDLRCQQELEVARVAAAFSAS